MSTVTASAYLHCPLARVAQYMRDAFEAAAETPKRLELRAHLIAEIELSEAVLITYAPLEDSPDTAWLVTWKPESGVFPSFEGRLSARFHAADEKTILDLDGEYEPPLGAAGVAFDKVLGHRLATDTAHEFLMDLVSEMRARYAYEQALTAFGNPPDPSPA